MRESKNLSYLIIFSAKFYYVKTSLFYIDLQNFYLLGRNNDQSGW